MTTATLSETPLIDVRMIAPPQRHPLIFGTFDRLAAGAAFATVNDHDPLPLQLQFDHSQLGEFEWNHRESGPAQWRVRIEQVSAEARAAESAIDASACCGHGPCRTS